MAHVTVPNETDGRYLASGELRWYHGKRSVLIARAVRTVLYFEEKD